MRRSGGKRRNRLSDHGWWDWLGTSVHSCILLLIIWQMVAIPSCWWCSETIARNPIWTKNFKTWRTIYQRYSSSRAGTCITTLSSLRFYVNAFTYHAGRLTCLSQLRTLMPLSTSIFGWCFQFLSTSTCWSIYSSLRRRWRRWFTSTRVFPMVSAKMQLRSEVNLWFIL